ncbi:hypothetical protein CUR49_12870 [Enterococcus faecalis]|nr:hypothetical protein CUR49_12870 [Enterococcus faecalis]
MEYIKRFFIVIGLFLLSQIGMFTYGTLKQSSLQVGQGTMPLLSTLILIVIFIMNIGLLLVLANKLELLNFDSVKSRLLCKMLYNVFTISTYQN